MTSKQKVDLFVSAAQDGRIEEVKRCLDEGLQVDSVNKNCFTALIEAAENGHKEVCELLFSRGCNVDLQTPRGSTALMRAATNGHKEVCELLVSRGCNVDLQHKDGFTALMFAAHDGHKAVCELLISRGCKLDLQHKDGETALMYAATNGHKAVCELLVSRGCNIDHQDKDGFTALILAAAKGHKEVCELLVSRGCKLDLQHKDGDGMTALMLAVHNGHIPTVICLIEAGCNYSLRNKYGKSALDYVKEKHSDKVKEVQAAIDRAPALLKKRKEEEAAAAVLKKNEEEAAAAVLQKKKEEEAAAALLQKKKEEEAAAAVLKKKEEDWRRLVNENREDIDDIKSVLSGIGLSKGKSQKYAEALVLTHKVDSVTKFQRKVGSDIAGYSATLQLDTDDVELLEEYFKQHVNVSTPPPPPPSPHNNTIDWSELDYVEVIGNGAYSVVLKAKYRSLIVAVKILTVNATLEALYELANDELTSIHNAEMNVLRRDTIIQAIGICRGALPPILLSKFNINISHGCGIVLRYEAGGSLESLLYPPSSKPKKLIPLQEKIRILMHIASGLDELHSAGILHGDIKPGNVLLSEHNPPLVRLADFGHAEIKEKSIDKDSELRDTVHRKGTPIYTAPECLPSLHSSTVSKITRRTDIYSFAIMAWEALNKNGRRAFANITNEHTLIHNVTVNDSRPELYELMDDVPPAVRAMIECCWDKDRAKRLTALQCHNTLELAYNIISQAKFDIFFSHPWKNKNVLRHVKKFLNSHGYRVWYDENDIGWDLAKSMQEGIENSQVVLVCLNKAYEASRNCMFELIESSKTNKKIVTLVTEPDPFGWAGSNATHGNVRDLCQLSTKMYIDIGELCVKPGWPAENDPLDTPVPDALLYELREKVAELIRLLQDNIDDPIMDVEWAKHAFEQKGPGVMIPVVMEPCMRNARDWTGLLGAALSTHSYIDFSSSFTDDATFDAKVNELVSSIGALLP